MWGAETKGSRGCLSGKSMSVRGQQAHKLHSAEAKQKKTCFFKQKHIFIENISQDRQLCKSTPKNCTQAKNRKKSAPAQKNATRPKKRAPEQKCTKKRHLFIMDRQEAFFLPLVLGSRF